MGNIVLTRVVIFCFAALCFVFSVSPYMGGKGKRFGIKTDKGNKTVFAISLFYTVISVFVAVIFLLLCISKNSYVFSNITIVLYILFMSAVYLITKGRLKALYGENIFREIIVNNPPKEYVVKRINPFLYLIYILPVCVTLFFGNSNNYVLWIAGIQTALLIFSYVLGIAICRFINYVDDNIEESAKKNVKYRKLWNINGFFVLLVISIFISVMYLEYLGILTFGGFGMWLPFVIFTILILVLIVFSVYFAKK